MQRTFSGFKLSIVASCTCSRWLACEGVHTVSRPSLKSAIAQDGPIDPWVCIGKSYVACSVRLPCLNPTAVSPADCSTSLRSTFELRTYSKSCDSSGSPAQSDHLATIAFDALMAAHSLVATTARKSPLRTARTYPLILRHAVSS